MVVFVSWADLDAWFTQRAQHAIELGNGSGSITWINLKESCMRKRNTSWGFIKLKVLDDVRGNWCDYEQLVLDIQVYTHTFSYLKLQPSKVEEKDPCRYNSVLIKPAPSVRHFPTNTTTSASVLCFFSQHAESGFWFRNNVNMIKPGKVGAVDPVLAFDLGSAPF